MRDPHVESIIYRLEDPDVFFEGVRDLPVDNPDFRGLLSDGTLTLRPKAHFSTVEEARVPADAFVRAWEISGGLALGHPGFQFRFEAAEAVGMDPDTGKPVDQFTAVVPAVVTATLHVQVPKGTYPPPPQVSRADPDAEAMWNRFSGYLEGKEPLLGMAYACLTILERGEHRRDAAARLSISLAVLSKLGNLSSARGDKRSARKWHPRNSPLTPDEEAWVRAAIQAIIKHLLTRMSGQKLSMSDVL